MNFEDYQKVIEIFAVYPRDNKLAALSYLAIGLDGEAGEVADEVKKRFAGDGKFPPPDARKFWKKSATFYGALRELPSNSTRRSAKSPRQMLINWKTPAGKSKQE